MVAEDVHWFDASTLEVLGWLLNAADGRLLVVITGRPGGWLPASWPVRVFDLAPLTNGQADELISALSPGLSANERAAVAGRCDGVPFYIEQVVAGLSETGVPEALYEPLFARLRASANVGPVVEAAAVIGRHIDRGLLGSVVDLAATRSTTSSTSWRCARCSNRREAILDRVAMASSNNAAAGSAAEVLLTTCYQTAPTQRRKRCILLVLEECYATGQ